MGNGNAEALPTAARTTKQQLRRIGTVLFLIAIACLLIFFAQRVEWKEVATALRAYRFSTLFFAALAASLSFLIYSTFDLFGRRATGHKLPTRRVMTIGFICYAFTQTLTAWVGGIALRYRLYSRFGVKKAAIAQIFGISALTNWMGYMLLAGIVCLRGVIDPPDNWQLGRDALRLLGFGLIVIVSAFLWCCFRFPNNTHTAFRQEWRFPPLKIGLLQVAGGMCNWASMAAVIFILFQQQVDYVTVLGILLLSSVAALISHIPAGLGVLEALFITMLAGDIERHQVLAVLVCYRAIYYLLPLLPATAIYAYMEIMAARARKAVDAAALGQRLSPPQ